MAKLLSECRSVDFAQGKVFQSAGQVCIRIGAHAKREFAERLLGPFRGQLLFQQLLQPGQRRGGERGRLQAVAGKPDQSAINPVVELLQ